MVDRYVKDIACLIAGTYPTALNDVAAAGIMGEDTVVVQQEGIIAVFQKASSARMTKYIGVSEKAAQIVLAISVLPGCSMCISVVHPSLEERRSFSSPK
mmetsp:Transcript_24517/g.40613  ORF Transcript_24517/g.40613 Transcript_24517/m.40613 type:complete len:99 (+) Transcript_24517:319-615(+)|eukprot:CAMPEP_0119020192 /NCGR_PEP_ID=MMETSP1176-20130426/23541_1 /TAXON_ID=265551 /ORGANISM="Synedropsis recta cf, Strain CCMP1620" /LENGTH=98 /DNA_ID=CAMNT_0006974583 /DNA_START=272 /DNA_END=568 /DNA_ORIENTATION=-